MTPIYGRHTRHDPRATPVPPRAISGTAGTTPGTTPVPPFWGILQSKSACVAQRHNGTAFRCGDEICRKTGLKAMKVRNTYIFTPPEGMCRAVVPPKNTPTHIWGVLEDSNNGKK